MFKAWRICQRKWSFYTRDNFNIDFLRIQACQISLKWHSTHQNLKIFNLKVSYSKSWKWFNGINKMIKSWLYSCNLRPHLLVPTIDYVNISQADKTHDKIRVFAPTLCHGHSSVFVWFIMIFRLSISNRLHCKS